MARSWLGASRLRSWQACTWEAVRG